ncbi:hypothetical protein [Achromobacter xylosoxidans]|uniref:hypothetical protein n=1 Tax=Alcaligenes xylosoxydans xylosoxydans TaxID=85698 RepID=UPI00292D3663|nr:hypothetical protein [Achromobacter xylosoxidans]WOB74352.1 hypothetical protein PZA07_02395 [Achromobacter xylosoxidans]
MMGIWTTDAGQRWMDIAEGQPERRAGRRVSRMPRRGRQDADAPAWADLWRVRVLLRRYDGRVRAALQAIWRASAMADNHAAFLALVHRYDNGRLMLPGNPGDVD